jgi:hypothetical protein
VTSRLGCVIGRPKRVTMRQVTSTGRQATVLRATASTLQTKEPRPRRAAPKPPTTVLKLSTTASWQPKIELKPPRTGKIRGGLHGRATLLLSSVTEWQKRATTRRETSTGLPVIEPQATAGVRQTKVQGPPLYAPRLRTAVSDRSTTAKLRLRIALRQPETAKIQRPTS